MSKEKKYQKKDIESFFPKTCTISKNDISSPSVGESLLKSFIPEDLHDEIFWGSSIGSVDMVKIKTEKEVIYNNEKIIVPLYLDKPSVKEGDLVTFKLRK